VLEEPAREAEAETCDALITAVRVFAARSRKDEQSEEPGVGRQDPPRPKRRYPQEVLVFDTETKSEPAQRLLFGVWRLYRDPAYGEPGVTCIEEGVFYPDDLESSDPEGFARLRRYADQVPAKTAEGFPKRIQLLPLSAWLQERLYRYAWEHRDRCHVVGFNLPFDLGRLASYWGPARGYYRGGWSLGLWGKFDERGKWHDLKYHRRLLMKAIDPRRTLFGWGSLKAETKDAPDRWKGFDAPFVDLHTLVFALTDRNYSLERACAAFGDDFKKADVRYGTISKKLVAYALKDVLHTGLLYRSCLAELRLHEGITLQPHRLYSPATLGTRYLEAMGVEKPLEKFADLDPHILGWSMSAFFGGRAEARIVRTPVPVAYLDAASMYPTVNALLGTWRLLVASDLQVEDSTDDVRALLASADLLDQLLRRETWVERIGVTIVELDHPDGDVLPVRGRYDPSSLDFGIGVNPIRYEGTLWYMLPDVLASALLAGRVPPVLRAVRLRPQGVQEGLAPVTLRGGPVIDPADTAPDPFVVMVEERRRAEQDFSLSEKERKRLGLFLKITANATAYGILARFDRKDLSRQQRVTVYGPDDEATTAMTRNPEDPGPFCFPPVAASLTAAARLMLAMLEHLVKGAGGSYAFCDTDSMAVVFKPRGGSIQCPTEAASKIKALSRRELVDILARFQDLNPYERELVPSLWKAEHESLDQPLQCYAISAKRYVLYRDLPGPTPTIVSIGDAPEEDAAADESDVKPDVDDGLVDWSEHGLGMYLDPRNPDNPERDTEERRTWIREAWNWVVARDSARPLPDWASRYALTRFTVSSPTLAKWFAGFDSTVPFEERMRPGSFGLIAHPAPLGRDAGSEGQPQRLPTAVYESNPERWEGLRWYDRASGQSLRVTTAQPSDDPETFSAALRRGDVQIKRVGDVISGYPLRAELKSSAPTLGRVTSETAGLLLRRPIQSAPALTDLSGKEGSKIIERLTGEVWDPEEYRTEYGPRSDRWSQLALPVLRRVREQIGAKQLADDVGQSRRAVERVTRPEHPVEPRARTKIRYLRVALYWATYAGVDESLTLFDLYAQLYCASKRQGLLRPGERLGGFIEEMYRYRLALHTQATRIEEDIAEVKAAGSAIEQAMFESFFLPSGKPADIEQHLRDLKAQDIPYVWRLRTDVQFLLTSVRGIERMVRGAVEVAPEEVRDCMRSALAQYARDAPDANLLRNIHEHFEAYAIGKGWQTNELPDPTHSGALAMLEEGIVYWIGGRLFKLWELAAAAESLADLVGECARDLI
jgi:hypothetical protein